jgi:hypothetical protein
LGEKTEGRTYMAIAIAAAANRVDQARKDRDYTVFEKQICHVAFAAIAFTAVAIVASGALALPHMSFFFSQGVPFAVLLVIYLYSKTLSKLEEDEAALAFAERARALGGEWQAYAERGLTGFLQATQELTRVQGNLAQVFTPNAWEPYYRQVVQSDNAIIYKALPDLLDAARCQADLGEMRMLGAIRPCPRPIRQEIGIDAPYFIRVNGGTQVSFNTVIGIVTQWCAAQNLRGEFRWNPHLPFDSLLNALRMHVLQA